MASLGNAGQGRSGNGEERQSRIGRAWQFKARRGQERQPRFGVDRQVQSRRGTVRPGAAQKGNNGFRRGSIPLVVHTEDERWFTDG